MQQSLQLLSEEEEPGGVAYLANLIRHGVSMATGFDSAMEGWMH